MIPVFIQGIKDGLHDIEIEIPVSEVENMFPEFFGTIKISGKLRKLGNRYSIVAIAECSSKLICDLSLKEFEELIEAEIKCSYLANNELYWLKDSQKEEENDEKIIHEDTKAIDISIDVREQLAVNLPLKRVSPELRDKEFGDIYPEYSEKGDKKDDDIADERWEPLKSVKFN